MSTTTPIYQPDRMDLTVLEFDQAHVARLVNSLKSRLTRLRTLQRAERELELKRALMGNGSKFLKNAPVQKKPLPNGRDLSWYDKLDRNELIEEQDEKERSEKLNAGIKTGAKVWVRRPCFDCFFPHSLIFVDCD